jgi:hypothetical protein
MSEPTNTSDTEEETELQSPTAGFFFGQVNAVGAVPYYFPQKNQALLPLLRLFFDIESAREPFFATMSIREALGFVSYILERISEQKNLMENLSTLKLLHFSQEDIEECRSHISSANENYKPILELLQKISEGLAK